MNGAQENPNMSDLNPENRANLLNTLKNKKLRDLTGRHLDAFEELSPNVRKRVQFLRELQAQRDELEAKFNEEKAALEAKYEKLYEPLYTKRYEIVNGIVGVIESEKSVEEKGVPDFWLKAMKHNEELSQDITNRDKSALKFLKEIKWSTIDEPNGFKLEFFFDTNPYFKNSVLTKVFHMIIEGDRPIVKKAIGTEIDWYPGKCLTHEILKKKPMKRSKIDVETITQSEECESFFNLFISRTKKLGRSPKFDEDEIDDEDDIDDEVEVEDEDEDEDAELDMDWEYKIGSIIREKIIPYAVSWFTGEASYDLDVLDDYNDDEDEEDSEEELEDRMARLRKKHPWGNPRLPRFDW